MQVAEVAPSLWFLMVRLYLHVTSASSSDTDDPFRAEFSDEKLQSLIKSLESAGYQVYVTSVGGSGLGILSPYDEIVVDEDDDSPPTTPDVNGEANGAALRRSIRRRFENVGTTELPKWASARGKWLYV